MSSYFNRLLERPAIKDAWARVSRIQAVELTIDVVRSYLRTNCSQMAAGVALFAMLSLLPLLIVMVSLLPLVMVRIFPHYEIRVAILRAANVTVSPVARNWLNEVLTSLDHNSLVVDVLSFLTFAWAASNVFSQLDGAFSQILKDGETHSPGLHIGKIVVDQVRQHRNAFVLFILALASFVSGTFLGAFSVQAERALSVGPSSPGMVVLGAVLSWVVSGLFLAMLYRWWMPGQVSWRSCILGAGIAAGADHLVRLLVTNFVDSTIGASYTNIGGPLALMLGAYLIIQNILIGAIIARQYSLLYGLEEKSAPAAKTA